MTYTAAAVVIAATSVAAAVGTWWAVSRDRRDHRERVNSNAAAGLVYEVEEFLAGQAADLWDDPETG